MSAYQPETKKRSWFFYDFVKITAALPGLLWFRPRLLFENDRARAHIRGGALLIANHIGFFDPAYLLFAIWYRRISFVCLQQFFDSSWAWFFRGVHCIPIDKQNVGMESVREIIRRLKAGELVSIFPEGHVNAGGETLDTFKSGAVLMAMRSACPIVPVYIRPKKHWYQRLTMVIGEPVDIKELLRNTPGVAGMEAASAQLLQKEENLKQIIGRK